MKRASLVFLMLSAACGSFSGSSPSIAPDAGLSSDAGDGGHDAVEGGADAGDDATAVHEIETLATGLAEPYGFVIDGTSAYIASRTNGASSVYRVSVTGGKPEILANNHTYCSQLTVDSTSVFYSCDDGLFMIKKDLSTGGTISPNPSSAVYASGDFVITCQYDGEMGRDITRIKKTGADPMTVASNIVKCESLAHRGSDVFFGGNFIGRLGTSSTPVPVEQRFARRLAVDDTHIWSLLYDTGVVRRTPIEGGPGSDFVLTPDGVNTQAGEVAVDATHVYWTAGTDAPGTGMLCRADKATSKVEVLARGLKSPNGVGLDSGFVYWTEREAGTFKRLQK